MPHLIRARRVSLSKPWADILADRSCATSMINRRSQFSHLKRKRCSLPMSQPYRRVPPKTPIDISPPPPASAAWASKDSLMHLSAYEVTHGFKCWETARKGRCQVARYSMFSFLSFSLCVARCSLTVPLRSRVLERLLGFVGTATVPTGKCSAGTPHWQDRRKAG
jgi:hypothetical protein